MANVKHDLIRRAAKRAMHGDCHLDHAQAGREMPAATSNILNHILAHLRRENGQFAVFEFFKVLERVDFIEYRITIHCLS